MAEVCTKHNHNWMPSGEDGKLVMCSHCCLSLDGFDINAAMLKADSIPLIVETAAQFIEAEQVCGPTADPQHNKNMKSLSAAVRALPGKLCP